MKYTLSGDNHEITYSTVGAVNLEGFVRLVWQGKDNFHCETCKCTQYKTSMKRASDIVGQISRGVARVVSL